MPYKDKEKAREQSKRRYLQHKELGLPWRSGDSYLSVEERRKRKRDYYHRTKHREEVKVSRKSSSFKTYLKSKYNISEQEYKAMLAEAKNKCSICEIEVDKLVIDHCHTTNKVRGLLCSNCNILLGMAKDSEVILYAAVSYLRRTREQVE